MSQINEMPYTTKTHVFPTNCNVHISNKYTLHQCLSTRVMQNVVCSSDRTWV